MADLKVEQRAVLMDDLRGLMMAVWMVVRTASQTQMDSHLE